MSQTSLFLTEVQQFFLDKCFSDCCNPFVHFHSSEKGDLDNFAGIFVASVGKQIYRGSYFTIPQILPSSYESFLVSENKQKLELRI